MFRRWSTCKRSEKGQVWGLVIRVGEACGEHEGPHCIKRGLGKSPKEALEILLPLVGLVCVGAHAGERAYMPQASQDLGWEVGGGQGRMRGLLRMLERALSLQGMGRCDGSAHSPENQGPFPSDRSEKAACLGMNWDSRWIQYSKLGMKKLGMRQILEQARREQIHQGLDHRIHPRMAGRSRSRTVR